MGSFLLPEPSRQLLLRRRRVVLGAAPLLRHLDARITRPRQRLQIAQVQRVQDFRASFPGGRQVQPVMNGTAPDATRLALGQRGDDVPA